MSEVYPNITWEVESNKVMTGSEWQMATASMVRSVYASMQLLEESIKKGNDPLKLIDGRKRWLTAVLYSCNMENYNETRPSPPV